MSETNIEPTAPDNIDKPKVLLLKILGVCIPWDFGRKTLVNYAKSNSLTYLTRNFNEEHVTRLAEQLQTQNGRHKASGMSCPLVQEKSGPDTNNNFKKELSAYFNWCLDNQMFKCGTPISELAGYIWGDGFANGHLKAELYPEVFETIKSWKSQNIKVFTFSSGSIEGQRSFFEHTPVGDVSKYLDGHISSSVAMLDKYDTACYAKVSLITGEDRNHILMLTNSSAEAKASTIAGLPAIIVERENNTCVVQDEARFFTRINKLTELKFK